MILKSSNFASKILLNIFFQLVAPSTPSHITALNFSDKNLIFIASEKNPKWSCHSIPIDKSICCKSIYRKTLTFYQFEKPFYLSFMVREVILAPKYFAFPMYKSPFITKTRYLVRKGGKGIIICRKEFTISIRFAGRRMSIYYTIKSSIKIDPPPFLNHL